MQSNRLPKPSQAFVVLLLMAGGHGAAQAQTADSIIAAAGPASRVVIYLHARILEEKPEHPIHDQFGEYDYRGIVAAFKATGATVIAEQRPLGTDFQKFGVHVADQVRQLIKRGVLRERISVVGFSKGGGVAIIASALLQEPKVNFVFLAPCGDWLNDRNDVDVEGRILSIYETSDELGTSCRKLLDRAKPKGGHREIAISTGAQHGAFFRVRPEWMNPVLEWTGLMIKVKK